MIVVYASNTLYRIEQDPDEPELCKMWIAFAYSITGPRLCRMPEINPKQIVGEEYWVIAEFIEGCPKNVL